MQFLDAIGLAYFWEKIKEWANSCFFSKEGGEINPGKGLSYVINGEHLGITTTGNENETINIFDVDKNGMEVISIKKSGGTATQVLMADGSVRTLNTSYGIAGLDANGNVPLANLGNLDTTVAEVVTALPTSNIKRHIYLVKDSDTTNNKYAEYVYTGDISAAYDSTKWEKLGDFRATVDLADYAKKSEAINEVILGIKENTINLGINYVNGDQKELILPAATVDHCGLMSPSDKTKLNLLDTLKVKTKVDVSALFIASEPIALNRYNDRLEVVFKTVGINSPAFTLPAAGDYSAGLMSFPDKTKLDGIAPNANNYSLPLAANGTRGGIQVGYAANGRNYPVQLSGEKAYVNVPWTDTNTTYDLSPYAKTADVNAALSKKVDVVSGKGLSTEDFTAALKTKLNGIATGATADSAIPTSVIDALN
ncbi:hypothetical protein [Prevotella sp.]|uniref:hypothetical protein n=1 Tax=Prevotella sp. TaxID=59823 RepID=UPI0027E24147|nr:hypothetical protein [Prevotella sp.]